MNSASSTKKVFWGLLIAGVLLTLIDLVYARKSYFGAEQVFGFYSFFGFVSCIVVVLVALGFRAVIAREESYYAPHDVETESYPDLDVNAEGPDTSG